MPTHPREGWDLVMTNPPYAVAGTVDRRRRIDANPEVSGHYPVPGSGIESLCLQAAIDGLRPGGRALAIVPDGLLSRHCDEELRRRLLRECALEAIVSLPEGTFHLTSKKTYLLAFTKKLNPGAAQTGPVLTYLVGEVGETRDAKRFPIPHEDDLPAAVAAFGRFQVDPGAFAGPEPAERLDDPRARAELAPTIFETPALERTRGASCQSQASVGGFLLFVSHVPSDSQLSSSRISHGIVSITSSCLQDNALAAGGRIVGGPEGSPTDRRIQELRGRHRGRRTRT